VGQPCDIDGDCCSLNCLDGVCIDRCRATNESCSEAGECCSEICDGGVCRCGDTDESCAFPEQCCNEQCNPETEKCEDAACGTVGVPCDVGCCDWLSCSTDRNLCCTDNLVSCGGDGECCGGLCVYGLCCADLGAPCEASGECCVGACSSTNSCVCVPEGGTCDIDNDCCEGRICRGMTCVEDCVAPGCHSACQVGPPLSAQDGNMCNDTQANSACIAEICAQHPDCCCKQWSASCVALYNNLTKAINSACYGPICPVST
jgi:hypothetical protein